MSQVLRELFEKLIGTYKDAYDRVWQSLKFTDPIGAVVRSDIPTLLEKGLDGEIYTTKGSVGSGRWTAVPWMAVFDSRITTSAQRGVYIVYLVNKDSKELFLTLNQGAKDIPGSPKEKVKTLKKRAEVFRYKIGTISGLMSGEINSGDEAYNAGCIFFKKYSLDSLPDDDVLYSDRDTFVRAYQLYYDKVFSKSKEYNEEGDEDLSVKNILDHVAKYIESKGFKYDTSLIENFYLSLKTKPFVLLAGTSGTGKTKLVRLFAKAIGVFDDGRYKQISVKPDWSDSTDLFGHVNLKNEFVPGAVIDFIKKAADDPEKKPYILCLDEMNLARVEYYFSDFLSVMETRDWCNKTIITDTLVPKACYSGNAIAEEEYKDLIIPENLFIVGTVNMDETTFPFSKKVLDRANTIEFSYVDFDLPDEAEFEEVEVTSVGNDFLKAKYLNLKKDCLDRWEAVKAVNDIISKLNGILMKRDAHFGYRVRDEIIFYVLYNEEMGLFSEKEAIDNQIMQKILPRIQGSSESIAGLLKDLFKVCAGSYTSKNGQSDARKMENYLLDGGAADYPKSANKICMMLRRYEDDDFTSFWV